MRTLFYALDDNVALGIEPWLARRNACKMNAQFGGSLVAVRLRAYLRDLATAESVAAHDADAATIHYNQYCCVNAAVR